MCKAQSFERAGVSRLSLGLSVEHEPMRDKEEWQADGSPG
jgi:hypothetical protein